MNWSEDGVARLHLVMGLQCNVRCTMCYQTDFSPKFNMDDVLWKEKLLPLYEHVRVVKLQGGEPTIMKNCRSAAQFLRSYPNAKLSIITNGVLIDDFWHSAFIEQGAVVSISINAASKEVYDKIVIHGEWDRVIRNIERLLANRRGKTPHVCVTMVILKENFHQIAALVDLAGRMKVDALEFGLDQALSFAGLPSRDHVAAELRRAEAAVERWPELRVDGLDEFSSRFALPLFVGKAAPKPQNKPMCGAPFRNLYVEWNGDVRVCCNTWVTIGNLHEKSIEDILQGHLRQTFQDKLKKGNYIWCLPQCMDNANPTRLAMLHKCAYELQRDPRQFWRKAEQKLGQLRSKVHAIRKRTRPLGDPTGGAKVPVQRTEDKKLHLRVVETPVPEPFQAEAGAWRGVSSGSACPSAGPSVRRE